MRPGELLYVPAQWYHRVLALDDYIAVRPVRGARAQHWPARA